MFYVMRGAASGNGPTVGEAIAAHPEIDMLSARPRSIVAVRFGGYVGSLSPQLLREWSQPPGLRLPQAKSSRKSN
jgi:hypothetical protein